jgi:alpha-L-arabinofuranosidase
MCGLIERSNPIPQILRRRDFMKTVAATSLAGLMTHDSGFTLEGERPAVITVHTDQPLGQINPRIFGQYTEETLTSFDGGVSSQLLFNRKFAMPEPRDARNFLFKGTSEGWDPIGLDTGVTLVLDQQVFFSPGQSQRITFAGGQTPAGIQQRGLRYVLPQFLTHQHIDDPFRFKTGERYKVRLAIKNQDLNGAVHLALGESYSKAVASHDFQFSGAKDWAVYECELVPSAEANEGKFMVYIDSPGTVWVDSASMVRADLDDGGFRKDALELTRRMQPTCIRWPGGWFVSDYHWQDGIGPVDKRPARLNRAWMAYTANDVGIDEFMQLCAKLSAEPYICVNVGTGTPEEAAALVEYVNGASGTKWGRVRAENGHPDPYGAGVWNVGNEEWLPTLGGTAGSIYATRFDAYARAMRAVDKSIELVAVGTFDIPRGAVPRDNPAYPIIRYMFDWNKEVLPVCGRTMDGYSVHHYNPEDDAKGFSAADMNRAAMVSAEDLGGKIDLLHQQMEEFSPQGKLFPVALDEWAVNIPDKAPEGASAKPPAGITNPNDIGLYGSLLTLREAVDEGAIYNLMQRRPKDFALATRTIVYAYTVGLIGIGRDRVVASPPALSLELFATHDQCESLDVNVQGPTFDVAPKGRYLGAKGAHLLDVSARLHPDGKTLAVFVVNRDLEKGIQASVRIPGRTFGGTVDLAIVNSDNLMEWNSFDHPGRVKIERSQVPVDNNEIDYRFPAHSISRLTVRLP